MAKTTLGKLPRDAIRMTELPRLPREVVDGYKVLVDLTGTISDAMDQLGIVGVVPAYVLPPVAPGKRVVGPAVTVRNIQRVAQIHKAATIDRNNTQGETEAHNLAEPGDVLVIQGVMGCSNMGGQSATIAKRQGFIGAVVDAKRWRSVAADAPEVTYRQLIARCAPIAERLAKATLVSPIRIIRDYSYTSTRFWGPGYLLAGDAACFVDPVFSTGVHLACLAGFLGGQAVDAVLAGRSEEAEALATYETAYRGAFERYLRFLYFFYDHNEDPDSYFWTARRLLTHTPTDLSARESFVRLISGNGDWDAAGSILAAEHARWVDGIRAGRPGAVPGLDVLRVRATTHLTGLPAGPRNGRSGES